MKLSTKLIVWLVPTLLLLYGVSQLWQQIRSRSLLTQAGAQALQRLDAVALQNAQNVQQCADAAIINAMAEGDMDKLAAAMTKFREVDGLLEFSVVGERGHVSYSSHPEFLQRTLDPEARNRLFAKPDRFTLEEANATAVYQPLVAAKACVECHTDWQENAIIGGTLVRFSNQSVRDAKSAWAASFAAVERSNLRNALITLVTLALLIVALSLLVTHRLIAAPLTRITRILETDCQQVHLASTQTASVSQGIADGASQQAASLEEASASLSEMSSMTRRSAENAENARTFTAHARKAADQGKADMEEMSRAMSDIKSASDNIARIIKTIDEIAFQTNLLALNAAVEAARAGEAGMGFAVVADEVRNLARRSAEAARETATRIEDCIGRSERGVHISTRVGASLEEIASQARQVDDLVNEIAAGVREQDLGISQLNQAVQQMDHVTQGNAARAEENATAARELRSQADQLRHAIDGLFALVEGPRAVTARNAPTSPAPAPATPSNPPNGKPTRLTRLTHSPSTSPPRPELQLH